MDGNNILKNMIRFCKCKIVTWMDLYVLVMDKSIKNVTYCSEYTKSKIKHVQFKSHKNQWENLNQLNLNLGSPFYPQHYNSKRKYMGMVSMTMGFHV
jgi:hypothetical protein